MSGILNLLLATFAAGGGLPAFKSVGAAGLGTNPTAALPADYVAGDILVIVGVSGGNFTTPAGWTAVVNRTSNPRTLFCWKVAGGSESNVVVATASSNAHVVMCSLENVSVVDDDSGDNSGSSDTPASGACTYTTAPVLALHLFTSNNNALTFSGVPPADCTTIYDGGGISNIRPMYLCWELRASSGASAGKSVTTSSSTNWAATQVGFAD